MEADAKPQHSAFSCCIVCLREERLTRKENEISTNVIKIYKNLVDEEINQLGTTILEICDVCIETLQNIETFRKQCLSSIDVLSGRMHFVYVENLDSDDVQIKLEDCYEEDSLPLKIEVCEEQKTEYKAVPKQRRRTKVKVECDQKREAAYCSICGEFFQRNLLKHIVNFHTMQIEDNKFKCNLCQEIFKDTSVIMDHFYKHRDYEHPKMCKVCGISFTNRQEYRVHVKIHNEKKYDKSQRSYPCDCCDATYASNTNLKYHVMAKHQGAMQCNYCNKAFFDKEEYAAHLQMEKEKISERKFYCDHCGYECKWKAALWLHMKKYHNPDEPTIICNDCGKSYKTKTQFRMHQVSTHLEKTHQCSDCGKKFPFATTLRKHIRLNHTEEGMFQDCKVCGKKLKSTSLRTHMSSVHQQIRKHKCDLCDMNFKTAGTLLKHKFSHTKTRPFNCNLCSTGYYQNEYLRKHFERVHGIVYSGADIRKICGKKSFDYLVEKERAQQIL